MVVANATSECHTMPLYVKKCIQQVTVPNTPKNGNSAAWSRAAPFGEGLTKQARHFATTIRGFQKNTPYLVCLHYYATPAAAATVLQPPPCRHEITRNARRMSLILPVDLRTEFVEEQ